MPKQPGLLRDLLTLMKARITVATTVATAAGYILASGQARGEIWLPLVGTFLLASGSSALNQCQEVDIDSRTPRTWNRPLPVGRLRTRSNDTLTNLLPPRIHQKGVRPLFVAEAPAKGIRA